LYNKSRVAPLIVKADLKHPTKVIQGVKVILMFFENMGVHWYRLT
jgi:hypothetical protein